MDIWWIVAVTNFIGIFFQFGECTSLTCLKGDDLPIPRDSTTVQDCGSHEYCSLEQYITPNGFIRHKASCKDSQMCGGSTVPSTYMVVCSECCDTNLCSATGCNSAGYNTTRGHICYHCDYPVDNPRQCDKIRVCSYDQVCGMHRNPFGQYQIGCESKSACNTIASIGVCSACCTTDLCNRNCIVSAGTAAPPVTCMDTKDCPTVSSAISASGGDVCQDQKLKYYCNSTCGLCSGLTTRAPCSTNPCIHGTCIPTTSSFVCACSPGYTGVTCDKIDACQSNPCIHGTCVSIPGTFHCTCHTNFTGRLCDTAIVINPCVPNPCVHGTCTISGNSYTCSCNSGYTGPTCAVQDPCTPNPCTHGQCAQSGSTFSCSCNAGYTGQTCSQVQDPCSPNPCAHGTCSSSGSSFSCSCNAGYLGTTCDIKDPCPFVHCYHGNCISTHSGGFRCHCQAGYSGIFCDTDIDECKSNPCLNGSCQDALNGYTCSCNPGYTGQQCQTVIKIRDCKDVQTHHHGSHNGVHRVDLGHTHKTPVLCDMTTDGGGWTVIMHRKDNAVDFLHKDSNDYALGFGDKTTDFWQGLEDMHALTSDGRRYQLRVDMVAANGSHFYEIYDDFRIGPAKNFTLNIGNHRGTAGDSLSGHNGFGFTTYDHDVDSNPQTNCAVYLSGSWWFHDCYDSCLTCPYVSAAPGTMECSSMSWNALRYCEPLKEAKMMVRPM